MAKDNKTEQAEAPTADKIRKPLKPLLVVAGLMVGEGVGIFALMKIAGGAPESAIAATDDAKMDDPLNLAKEVELELCKFDSFNRKEGRLFVYHIELSVLVAEEDVDRVTSFVEVRSATIRDRVQVVVRAADPKELNDPSLEAIRRQFKFELNKLLGGKEVIRQVLISKLLQSRSNV